MIDESAFILSEAKKNEICSHLTPIQKQRALIWMKLQETLNKGDFVAMDGFFDADFTYGNPSRPDLGSYASWKTSPVALYKTFPPCLYRTLAVTARSDDEIWVYCHHAGKQTGGNYMGVPPKGQEINVQWFSMVTFKGSKILRIFSIADVLGMFINVGVIDPKMMPVDPYK
jgi:predicted ester cyclase